MAERSSECVELVRRLGLGDAVVIGLGSMIGAGVFAVFGPAAAIAGTGLLVGLVVAAVIAYCNAVATAQLAAAYPTSGGTYIYGRERLGHWWGFTAGWGFVIGKTASCAAMALTFASYALPTHDHATGWAQRLIAVAAVIGLTALNYRGVTKTARLTRILVTAALLALALVIATLATRLGADLLDPHRYLTARPSGSGWSVYGLLQSAGLLFFAFAGYARIATLGEEVRDPRRTIPRAILIALAVTVALYLLVAVTVLGAAGPERLAATTTPLAAALHAAGADALAPAPAVRVGAALASLGALLALIAGIGRTTLAMARHDDLPAWLAGVHPRYRVPHHAELALATIICALVLTTDLRGVIGFSSFGVLVYYAIANIAALTQPAPERRWPRGLNTLGLAGCATLAATLPWQSVLAGTLLFTIGLTGRVAIRARRARPDTAAGRRGRAQARRPAAARRADMCDSCHGRMSGAMCFYLERLRAICR